jgi:hypothetical protein
MSRRRKDHRGRRTALSLQCVQSKLPSGQQRGQRLLKPRDSVRRSLTGNCATAVLCTAGILMIAALAGAPVSSAATIYSCKGRNGVLRVVSRKTRCKKHEARLSWNATGPAGENGTNGKNGVNGSAGPSGRNGANGAVAGYSASLPAEIEIPLAPSTGDGSLKGIVSKTLPAGNYIVWSNVQTLDQASTEGKILSDCSLESEGTILASATAFTPLVGTSLVAVQAFSADAAMDIAASTVVSLSCAVTSEPGIHPVVHVVAAQILAIQTTTTN